MTELYESGLPISEIFGMPLHPLLVHGAVVLLPLAGVGAIYCATKDKRSKQFGGAVSLIALVGTIFAFLSMASGRDLRDAMGMGSRQHFELGEWLPWFGLALTVAMFVMYFLDKKSKAKRNPIVTILSLGVMVIGLATIGWTVYTGHTGAELVWG